MKFRSFASVLGVAASVLAFSAPAAAKPITFVYQGTASGTLGGEAFTNATFTITGISDTDVAKVRPQGVMDFENAKVTIDIAGMGSVTLLTLTRVLISNALDFVSLNRLDSETDIFGLHSNSDFEWDFVTSFAFTGSGLLNQPAQVSTLKTSGGELIFTNADGIAGKFEAIVDTTDDVPEPAALGLFGLGLVGLGCARRRRQA